MIRQRGRREREKCGFEKERDIKRIRKRRKMWAPHQIKKAPEELVFSRTFSLFTNLPLFCFILFTVGLFSYTCLMGVVLM